MISPALAGHQSPGNDCLNNRHYDPLTGTFTSVDPLVTTTLQPYIYGAANPVTYSDPSGLDPDTSSIYRHRGYDYCTSAASTCGTATTLNSFGKIRHTDRGQAIGAVIDIAHQQNWDKVDGYWSMKDLIAAQNPAALLELLGTIGRGQPVGATR